MDAIVALIDRLDAIDQRLEDLEGVHCDPQIDTISLTVERAKLHQRERRTNRLLERILAELRRLNAASLAAHRETGRKCCDGQANVRRRQQGQVGRMEVR